MIISNPCRVKSLTESGVTEILVSFRSVYFNADKIMIDVYSDRLANFKAFCWFSINFFELKSSINL